jgi:ADP-ribose pyrophosphatase
VTEGPEAGGAGHPADDRLRETVVGSRTVYNGHYIQVRVDDILGPDGRPSTRDIVEHPGAVAIVAVDPQDQVLMVRQFRLAAGRTLLEIPAGTLDRGADGSLEDPDLAARRELEEETGYRAGTWRHLGAFWTAPGFTTELLHLYLATDLEPAREDRLGPDEDERLELEHVPWDEALAMAERGDIPDAKSLVGLYRVDHERHTLAAAAGVREWSAASERAGGVPEPGSGRLAVARTRITFGDRVRATSALARMSRGTIAFGLLVLVGALILLTQPEQVPLAIIEIALGIALLSGLYCVPIVWWAARRRPDLFNAELVFEADGVGIRMAGAYVTGSYLWATFRRVREREGFFFLDMLTGMNVFLPVKAFDAENLRSFRALLINAGYATDGKQAEPPPPG